MKSKQDLFPQILLRSWSKSEHMPLGLFHSQTQKWVRLLCFRAAFVGERVEIQNHSAAAAARGVFDRI